VRVPAEAKASALRRIEKRARDVGVVELFALWRSSFVPDSWHFVEGAYTSIVDRGQELYPFFPIALMATQRFPSLDRIQLIKMPKLFLHSPEDSVIPYAHGRRLFDTARDPKQFVDVRGGHDNAYRVDRSVYYGAIAEFLRDTGARR